MTMTGLLDDFTRAEVGTGETTIFLRSHGSGPPILLLHGFPQTHLMWRGVAPLLAHDFTIVCADLRGYGKSGCPPGAPDHAPYAKRAMARDMVAVMERLGFSRFSVAGHDRGGRVGYRMALDHPDRVKRLAVLDILPTETVWDRTDARLALAFWPWSLLAQPEPLPERILVAVPDAVIDNALGEWGSPADVFPPEVRAAYVEALRDPAHAMQYARSIAPPRLSTASTTGRIVPAGAGSPVRCWRCGAPEGQSTSGMPRSPAHSRFGKTGRTMFRGGRSKAATSFQRKPPNRPRKP
jgi:pimeloyl-ACP methyl ester carboxylesterase